MGTPGLQQWLADWQKVPAKVNAQGPCRPVFHLLFRPRLPAPPCKGFWQQHNYFLPTDLFSPPSLFVHPLSPALSNSCPARSAASQLTKAIPLLAN
jgi:hypothetical protein